MNLYPLRTSHLQYVESGEFIIRLLTDFNNQGIDAATDPEIQLFYNSLQQQSPIFNKALLQVRARAESQLLLNLDEARDNRISMLRRAFSAYEITDDTAESTAYQNLKPLFTTYQGIEKMNFEAESLAVDRLTADLQNATYDPFVKTLGLTKYIDRMQTANVAFKTTFSQRSTAIISTEVFDAKQLRKNILDTYKDMAQYVLVMTKLKKTPYYTTLLNTINSGRSYYADILARRKGTAKTTKPEA